MAKSKAVLRSQTGAGYLESLSASAIGSHGVPESLARRAVAATKRRLDPLMTIVLNAAQRRRVRAYFWGVIRGEAISSRGEALRSMRSRYLIATVVSDLKAAGRDSSEIMHEVEQLWGPGVEDDVLAEYRLRLCG